MANNIRCYVPTATNGIYYTADLYATPPIWTQVNTGLGATDIWQFDIDPGDKVNRQALILDASRDSYIRLNEGNWQSLLTQAEFRTETGDANAVPIGVLFDADESGRIWVYGARFNAAFNAWVYFVYSDDNGASWTAIAQDVNVLTPFLAVRNVEVGFNGQEIVFTSSNGSDQFCFRSTNLGGAWNTSGVIGTSAYDAYVYLRDDVIYTAGNGNGPIDLLSLDKTTLAITVLQDTLNLGPDRPDRMIFVTDSHQRLIKNNKLYITTDTWSTVVDPAPANLDEDGANAIAVSPDDEDITIVGRTTSIAIGDPETILYLPNEGTINLDELSGADPTGGVDSIIFNAGGAVSYIEAFGVAPSSVTITPDGDNTGLVCDSQEFTATVTGDPTEPLTYTWSTDGLIAGQGTDTATYAWESTGTHTVSVIVSNIEGSTSDSTTVTIELTLMQIADAIAQTLENDVTATLNGEPVLFKVMSYNELSEGMNDSPACFVYNTAGTWDQTGDIDRFSMSGKHKVQDYTFRIDYFATPRNQLEENMELWHYGVNAIVDVLLAQDCPAFDICVLELVSYEYELQSFLYASMTQEFVGARFTLNVRVF